MSSLEIIDEKGFRRYRPVWEGTYEDEVIEVFENGSVSVRKKDGSYDIVHISQLIKNAKNPVQQ